MVRVRAVVSADFGELGDDVGEVLLGVAHALFFEHRHGVGVQPLADRGHAQHQTSDEHDSQSVHDHAAARNHQVPVVTLTMAPMTMNTTVMTRIMHLLVLQTEARRPAPFSRSPWLGLGRSAGTQTLSARVRAQALGVHVPPARRRWRASEDQTLRDGYARGLTCVEISHALSGAHTPGAVSARARKLGLTSYAQTWNAEQDELLRQAITTSATVDDLATVLTRSSEAVRRRAQKLGLPAPSQAANARSGLRWARFEDVLLIENRGVQPGVLARRLGRSDHAVRRRQRLLGVRTGSRSPHYAPANGAMSPAEERLILRELNVAGKSGGRLLALAGRLGRTPAELRQRSRALLGAATSGLSRFQLAIASRVTRPRRTLQGSCRWSRSLGADQRGPLSVKPRLGSGTRDVSDGSSACLACA